MNPEERRAVDEFKVAISLMQTGPDGFPTVRPMLPLELHALGLKMLAVSTILARRGELNPEERSLNVLTVATSEWIAATESGTRDPDTAQAWFRARAELIEPYEGPRK